MIPLAGEARELADQYLLVVEREHSAHVERDHFDFVAGCHTILHAHVRGQTPSRTVPFVSTQRTRILGTATSFTALQMWTLTS